MKNDRSGPAGEMDFELRQALDKGLGCSESGDEALLARVKARVFKAIAAEAGAQHRTIRPADGNWQEMGPGVERKLLRADASCESWMVRLAPGAVVRGHFHPGDEECVVLDGSIRIGADLVLRKGDFHVAASGSMHEDVTTDTGALVYLRGAPVEVLPR